MVFAATAAPSNPAAANKPPTDCERAVADVDDTAIVASAEAGGRHWRIPTPRGPVHVFRPRRHAPRTGGIVVYAHGYRTDIDTAWCEHKLAAQFAASGRDALFIAPEVPAGLGTEPPFPELGEVIRIARRAGVERPWGPIVVVGHSGAYRTIAGWLDYRDLDHVALLDGFYGREDIYLGWLNDPRAPHRRLTIVANDTLRWTEPALAEIADDIAELDQIPRRAADVPAIERRAKVLYIKSQLGHMAIVEDGVVIPIVLELTGLAGRRG